MSIQDESFPYDDDLEFSSNSGKALVFPHHKPRRSVMEDKEANENEKVSAKKISPSSLLQNQSDSTESSNEFCLTSETSGKTNASEPHEESETKRSEFTRRNQNKSISYQDIHSEYTKRRYKHVESKVGQYIANMKAEDEKRRNSSNFQRHSSMPETLHGRERTIAELNTNSENHDLHRCSTNDLHRIHNSQNNDIQSYHDADNYGNLTATTSSISNRDSSSENGIYIDKHTYEQLLSDKERKDYLQTKLEEKNAENWRLKQNLDKMRIEYSMCKDKLKQQTQAQRISGSFGCINRVNTLTGTSLQSLLYTQEIRDKSTQTDILLTPSPIPPENKPVNDMFATPITPDFNNNSFDHAAIGMLAPAGNKVPKCIATIQPLSLNFSSLVDQDCNSSSVNTTMGILRQRSNSLAVRKKSTPIPGNVSKTSSAASSGPTSSDSAIDIEVVESPKPQHQHRCEEFIYYERHPQCYPETTNSGQNFPSTQNSSGIGDSNIKRNRRKRHKLRSRMMRLFRACGKCKDPNTSLETANNSLHSQIPLLEKSTENCCHNVR